MKLIFFKYGKDHDFFKKGKGDLLERVLFTFFIFLFTMVIFSQISFLGIIPESAKQAAGSASMEGEPLGVEEYLYTSGTIELRLMSGERDPELAVLVNGEKAAAFEEKDVQLEVAVGDIIEIDGTNSGDTEVALSAVSSNLNRDLIGKIFSVNGEIKDILKVKQAETETK